LPGFLLLALITALGVGLWLSALNVEYRDVRYVVPFLTQFWLFATPIAYPSSLRNEPWRTVYGLNPMVGVVEGFRWALLGTAPRPLCGELLLVPVRNPNFEVLESAVRLPGMLHKHGSQSERVPAVGAVSERRVAYARLLDASLRHVVDVLSKIDDVERVSIFGSYARQRRDLFTDLDILVIMDTRESFLERQQRLYSLLVVPVDMDLLCYTPAEFGRLKQRPFLKRVLQEEVVLYEKGRA
jgi:predicted nucleotidyltransferase